MTNTSTYNLAKALSDLTKNKFEYDSYTVFVYSTSKKLLLKFKMKNIPKDINVYLAKYVHDYDIMDTFKRIHIVIKTV